MAEGSKTEITLNDEIIKKEIIPDNDYLPFIKVKEKLLEMAVGDIQIWPLKKLNSVRITARRIRETLGHEYRYKQNRKAQTVEFCRFS